MRKVVPDEFWLAAGATEIVGKEPFSPASRNVIKEGVIVLGRGAGIIREPIHQVLCFDAPVPSWVLAVTGESAILVSGGLVLRVGSALQTALEVRGFRPGLRQQM